ncbi:MAG: M1 family metallopeptidase [Planctomycetota bacterium]
MLAALAAAALLAGPAAAQEEGGAARSPGALRPFNLVREPLGPDTPGGTLERGGRCRTDYVIRARVERFPGGEGDDVAGPLPYMELDGSETITWTNASDDAVDELWFHVYLNAFANNRTTHLEEADGRLRGTKVTEGFGYTEIRGVRVAGEGGADLAPSLTFESPDDGNEYDRTVFRVELPEPVAPGATLSVEVDWHSRLPRVRRRTGTKDDFMLVAQWFPKLGVYESGRGWNCHQFHAWSEFYADFGTYDVELDLPGQYWSEQGAKVFGTGVRVNSRDRGDRVVVSFLAPSEEDRARTEASGRSPLVHDFMWTADTRYVSYIPTDENDRPVPFHFADWAERYPDEVERVRAALGPDVKLDLRDVTVEVLIHPERLVQAKRHYDATCATLFFYGLWFGEYPFERITVVDPAWGAGEAGGMEYPTIFTAGTSLFTEPEMHSPESVVVHECGHQWFYLLAANNEFEAAWMDEGFNSYADSEVLHRVYGDSRSVTRYSRIPIYGVQLVPTGNARTGRTLSLRDIDLFSLDFVGIHSDVSLQPVVDGGFVDWWRDQPLFTNSPEYTDPRWGDRARYRNVPDVDPIDTWPWMAAFRESHYSNTHSRTACVLRSMPALIAAARPGVDGEKAFLRGMRTYTELWRYRHPYPDDFIQAFQEGDGVDLDLEPYFDDLLRNTLTVDWYVQDVEVARPDRARGVFMDDGGSFVPWTDFIASARPVDTEPTDAADGGTGTTESTDATTAAEPRVVEPDSRGEAEPDPYRIEVVLGRRLDLALPVPVRLTFADGTTRELVWSREEQLAKRTLTLRFESPQQLRSVEIDPSKGYFLDLDMSNNQWFADADKRVPMRWTERVFSQLSQQFQWQKGIGG